MTVLPTSFVHGTGFARGNSVRASMIEERGKGRAQSSPFPFASYVLGIDLRIVALDFLNQPFEHAQIGVRVRLRSDRPLGSMRMGKCVEVIVHVRMVFRESLFPEPVQPVALDEIRVLVELLVDERPVVEDVFQPLIQRPPGTLDQLLRAGSNRFRRASAG